MQRENAPHNSRVSVRIPGKLNLFLAVRGASADGYHDLVTVLQTVSVYDVLHAELIGRPGRGHHPASRRRMRVELGGDVGGEVPDGPDNLVLRASRRLGERTGIVDAGVRPGQQGPRTVVDLRKSIPVAGGMAGGSADAAAALVALNDLWGCELDRDELRDLAADLGSDVPFCVVGGTALATGRGTAVAQVLCRGTFHWVVCTASEPLSTAEVYRAWDRHCRTSEVEPDAVLHALRGEDPLALGAALHNELEPAAFALRPELARHKELLYDEGALGAVLSGSGPTLLALADDGDRARELAERLRPRFWQTLVARSPAGGPDLSRSPTGQGR